MPPTEPVHARIHVLLAREARTGVVIRRGPTKQVCTIGWNLRDDTFTVGQWFKGRIYERRCDLSPDGKHMIYFAMNGQWQSEAKGAWTAISCAPYIKAIGLWPKGDCWNGGGLFADNTHYWLNQGCGEIHNELRTPQSLQRVDDDQRKGSFGSECPGIYYPRLVRDGWTLGDSIGAGECRVRIFEKRIKCGWVLRKLAIAASERPPGKGCYYDEHELVNANTREVIAHPDWEWADLDGKRLVWSEAGKLYACHLNSSGLGDAKELYDFNSMSFENLTAPY